ncbi:MAG TPA: WhiB family transcriptional regulator [Natronosporangium sp.]|nr:WhiB family transcriptional regulator [Natronosporangium sp.]
MTRARTPRPHEIEDARRDQRLLRAFHEGGRDPAWRTRGVCQSVDPETFFPAPSEPADPAIELCRSCPVQGACLAWALEAGDLHGVWGGTTARERRAMAVVWRGWQHGGESPLVGAAAGADPGESAAPAAGDLPVGAAMDRAELLRLVRAG